jgi:hypothetical protein
LPAADVAYLGLAEDIKRWREQVGFRILECQSASGHSNEPRVGGGQQALGRMIVADFAEKPDRQLRRLGIDLQQRWLFHRHFR